MRRFGLWGSVSGERDWANCCEDTLRGLNSTAETEQGKPRTTREMKYSCWKALTLCANSRHSQDKGPCPRKSKRGNSAAVYRTRNGKFHQSVSGSNGYPHLPGILSSSALPRCLAWVQLLWGCAQPASGCRNPFVAQLRGQHSPPCRHLQYPFLSQHN